MPLTVEDADLMWERDFPVGHAVHVTTASASARFLLIQSDFLTAVSGVRAEVPPEAAADSAHAPLNAVRQLIINNALLNFRLELQIDQHRQDAEASQHRSWDEVRARSSMPDALLCVVALNTAAWISREVGKWLRYVDAAQPGVESAQQSLERQFPRDLDEAVLRAKAFYGGYESVVRNAVDECKPQLWSLHEEAKDVVLQVQAFIQRHEAQGLIEELSAQQLATQRHETPAGPLDFG